MVECIYECKCGVYRAMVKSRNRLGTDILLKKHARMHRDMCQEKAFPLQAAIILDGPPSIVYVAVAPVPYGVDKYVIAGDIAGDS